MKPFWFIGSNHSSARVLPAKSWPAWVQIIAQARSPADAGIGDTIARTIGPVGGELYKSWFKTTFGRSCGCVERQTSLNQRFPYSIYEGQA